MLYFVGTALVGLGGLMYYLNSKGMKVRVVFKDDKGNEVSFDGKIK